MRVLINKCRPECKCPALRRSPCEELSSALSHRTLFLTHSFFGCHFLIQRLQCLFASWCITSEPPVGCLLNFNFGLAVQPSQVPLTHRFSRPLSPSFNSILPLLIMFLSPPHLPKCPFLLCDPSEWDRCFRVHVTFTLQSELSGPPKHYWSPSYSVPLPVAATAGQASAAPACRGLCLCRHGSLHLRFPCTVSPSSCPSLTRLRYCFHPHFMDEEAETTC